MKCRACGFEHSPMLTCGTARAKREASASVSFELSHSKGCSKADSNMANGVANTKLAVADVANSMANKTEQAGGTYRYRDVEARRAYQRELMRKRRAGSAGVTK